MPYAPLLRSPDQDAVLDRILATARRGDLAVLDLDGCLFDNRWRQVRILHELAGHRDWTALAGVEVEHFEDWSLSRTLRNAGVPAEQVEARRAEVRAFWEARFFDGSYTLHDRPMPGAVPLVRALHRAGMEIAYLTGRDVSMAEGSALALARAGFPPLPEAHLLCKPDAGMTDEAWKMAALPRLRELGEPALFLDNEPCNVNGFRREFPEALVVFVATDHSFRPDLPDPALPRIRGFLRTAGG
mgnify:CR=1 FL=1